MISPPEKIIVPGYRRKRLILISALIMLSCFVALAYDKNSPLWGQGGEPEIIPEYYCYSCEDFCDHPTTPEWYCADTILPDETNYPGLAAGECPPEYPHTDLASCEAGCGPCSRVCGNGIVESGEECETGDEGCHPATCACNDVWGYEYDDLNGGCKEQWCIGENEYQCGGDDDPGKACCIDTVATGGCYTTSGYPNPITGESQTQYRCADCNGCYDACRDKVNGDADYDIEDVRSCMDGCRSEYGDDACEPSVCPGTATMCGDNLTCCISGNCIKGDRLEGCDANDDYCFEYTCAEGTSGGPEGGNGTGDIGDVGGIAETGDITGGETGGTGASGGNGGSTKSQTMSGNTSSPKPPSSSSKKSSSTSATTWSGSSQSSTTSTTSTSKTSSSKTSSSSRSSSSLSTQTTSASTSAQSSEACDNIEYKLEMCEIMGASSVNGSENDPDAICEVCSECALQQWNNQVMKFCQWQTCEGWGGKFIACGGSSSSTSRSTSSSSHSSSSSSSRSSSSSSSQSSSSSLIAGIGGATGTTGITGTTGGTTGTATGGNTGGISGIISSSSSSSTSSVLTLVGGACFGTECEYGGDFFCQLQGKTCFQTAAFPCLECIRTTSKSSSSARSFSFSLASLSFSEPSSIPPAPRSAQREVGSDPSIPDDPLDPSLITASACSLDAPCGTNEFCVANECLSEEEVFLLPPFCGNARRDSGEQCDEGSLNSDRPNALCRPDCTIGRCGDTIRDTPLELCDDGNITSGDGCSALCQIERGAPQGTLPAQVVELPLSDPSQPTIIAGVPANQQNIPSPPRTSDTGPAALALMIAGASAGYAFMKRKRK